MRFSLSLAVLLQTLTIPLPAQSFTGASSHELRGELVPASAVPSGCVLELKGLSGAQSYMVDVTLNGNFRLTGIAQGRYKLEVKDGSGTLLKQEYLEIPLSYGSLTVQLPRKESSPAQGSPGTVSVQRLSHHVPKSAQKQLQKAMKASAKGDLNEAIQHLQRALEEDPYFVEAHNNLGAQYLKQSRIEQAVATFRHAESLDPESARIQSNLALALLTARQPEEAEPHARKALSIQPASSQARYVLGCTQFALRKELDDAARNLSLVAAEFPRANLLLGALLAQKGNHREAEAKLKNYLGSANPNDRELVNRMLQSLMKRE